MAVGITELPGNGDLSGARGQGRFFVAVRADLAGQKLASD